MNSVGIGLAVGIGSAIGVLIDYPHAHLIGLAAFGLINGGMALLAAAVSFSAMRYWQLLRARS